MSKRTCSGCDANPPRTPEYFSCDKNSPDGLFHRCKICEADRKSIHYANNWQSILDERYTRYHSDPEYRERMRAYNAQKKRESRARQREQLAASA